MKKSILVLAANPKNTSRLRLDQEVREIDNGLQRSQKRNGFTLNQKWAVRREDFRRAMLDYKPNIVHFCGHGAGEEGIAFEDETGYATLVSSEALAEFFELFSDKVESVVLNACYSEIQAEAIAQHIDYVIGMKSAIGDEAAIEFAVAFYDALGAGESIKFAYRLALNAIKLANLSRDLIPSLKERDVKTSGKITEPQAYQFVGRSIEIQGELNHIKSGDYFWISIKIGNLFWPKEIAIPNSNGEFKVTIYEGGNPESGLFSIVLLQVPSNGHKLIQDWIRRGNETGDYPGITTVFGATELDIAEVRLNNGY